MTFRKRQKKPWSQLKDQWLPRLGGEGGLTRWSTEDSGGGETILYDTVMGDTCHYTFVKTE